MRKSTLILFMTLLAFAVGAADANAQANIDPLRRWDESVDALLRKVAPSVVQIMVTGYGTVSEGDREIAVRHIYTRIGRSTRSGVR